MIQKVDSKKKRYVAALLKKCSALKGTAQPAVEAVKKRITEEIEEAKEMAGKVS
jgi:hypothetical protein